MSRHPSRQPSDESSKKPTTGRLPTYNLLLHSTLGKDLMYVARTVMELLHYGRAEATHRMWEAHHSGKSLLLATHLERAELYAELFRERGLNVSLVRA